MAFSTSAVADILKIDYQGPIREQLNNATVLATFLKRNRTAYRGSKAYIPLHMGRNGSVNVVPTEGGALPSAGNQGYQHAEYNAVEIYGSIEITTKALSVARDDIGSFARALDSEQEGLRKDCAQQFNRQLCGDGTAILTQVNDAVTSSTMTVQSTKHLKQGMPIQIASATIGAYRHTSVLYVGSILSKTQIVLHNAPSGGTPTSTSSARTATDVVVLDGARTTSSPGVKREMWGIQAVVDSANPGTTGSVNGNSGFTELVGGIDRSTNLFWQGNVLGNGGTLRPLSIDLMQEAFDTADIEGSDSSEGNDNRKSPTNLIITNHAIKRRYAAQLVSDKRYPAGGEITLDGGWRALEFNEVPLVADKDIGATLTPQKLNRLYFLNLKSMELLVSHDWEWLDDDGAVLKLKPSSSGGHNAAFVAYFGFLGELAACRPNANAVLTDIDENP